VDGIRSLSSVSCGTYTNGSAIPLCLAQESFSINDTNQYVVYLEGIHMYLLYNIHALPSFQIDTPYGCDDNMALATPDNWVVSCPLTEDVVSRSPEILSELPNPSPANEICKLRVHITRMLYQSKLHPKNKVSGS